MATHIAKQLIDLIEIYPTYSDADPAGNTCDSGDRVFLHLKNDNPASVAASVTVTIDDPNTVEPRGGTLFDPDLTVVLGAQMQALVGPLPAIRFGSSPFGYVNITYDDATNVTLAVYELSPPIV